MNIQEIAAKRGKLGAVAAVTALPKLDCPDGAGVRWNAEIESKHPERVVAIQVALTQRDDKLAGAAIDTMRGKAHRLEVTRMFPLSRENGYTPCLNWRVPSGQEEYEGDCRIKRRHSLLMDIGGPAGMKNLRNWTKVYGEIRKAVEWAKDALDVERGVEQYALILVADITPWVDKEWTNAQGRTMSFREAKILGIGHLELVRLTEPETTQPEPEDAGDDDFIPEYDD